MKADLPIFIPDLCSLSPSPEPQLWHSEPLCGQFLTGLKSGSWLQKRDKWDCCFYRKRAAVVVIAAAWLHSWFPLHSSRQLLIRHFWCNLGFLTFVAFINLQREGDWINVSLFMNSDLVSMYWIGVDLEKYYLTHDLVTGVQAVFTLDCVYCTVM